MNLWDWQVFCTDTISGEITPRCFGENGSITYLDWMLSAWGWTLSVAVCALAIGVVMGTIIGVIRTFDNKLILRASSIWIDLFRNVPLLLQVFLWYHVAPQMIPGLSGTPRFVLVVTALGLFTSARIAEQVRTGIQAIPKGQRAAGQALGLTRWQTYRFILLPVAFRIIAPPLTSEAMTIVKNSSVAFAVSVSELTMFAMQAQEETSRGIEIYLAVTLLYFASTFTVNLAARRIENRFCIPGMLGFKK